MLNCFLCEKFYNSGEKFYLYLCYDCHNKTSFCINCDKIMMKIFENNNIFKCGSCRKITLAIMKQLIEVNNFPDLNNLINISAINEMNLSPIKNINENKNNNINDNLNINTPEENKIIYQQMGNKILINTPSSIGSFYREINNNNSLKKINEIDYKNNSPFIKDNNLQIKKEFQNNIDDMNKKEEFGVDNSINNISNLTDYNNTSFKIKNNFNLITNNNEKKLINKKQNGIINYFNFNDNKNLKELNNNLNKEKSEFSGYNKKIKKEKNEYDGYNIKKF